LRLWPRLFSAGSDRGGTPGRTTEILGPNSGRRPGDPAAIVAGADLIRSMLGWKPEWDDLDTMVGHAFAWERLLMKDARGGPADSCLRHHPSRAYSGGSKHHGMFDGRKRLVRDYGFKLGQHSLSQSPAQGWRPIPMSICCRLEAFDPELRRPRDFSAGGRRTIRVLLPLLPLLWLLS